MALPKYERNFKGAIRLANWVKHTNWYPSTKNNPNISEGGVWPALKNAVQKERQKPINRYSVDYLTSTSICIEKPDFYEILIPASFNRCHRRFALCKELCHVLADDKPSDKCRQPLDQLLKAVVTGNRVRNSVSDGALCPLFTEINLESEHFCFLVAVEILIPISIRDQILTDVKISGKKSPFQVATELRIPQTIVQFFIDSQYNAEFKRLGGPTLLATDLPSWTRILPPI